MNPQFRTGLYFFVQFFSSAVFHAYGGIWFQSQGFTSNQIASFVTVPVFVMLLMNLFSGRIADKAKDWKQALVIASLVAAIASFGLIFSKTYAVILLFWTIAQLAQSISVPIGDGAALYLTKQGRGDIGFFRSLSTFGYILTLFLTSYLIFLFGGAIFAALFAATTSLRLLVSLVMPDFKSANEQKRVVKGLHVLDHLRSPGFMLPLAGWALVSSTIMVLNGFLAVYFHDLGYTESTIGLLIAIGAMAEAIVFFTFRQFSAKIDLRAMIVLSCIVSVARWASMTYAPSFAVMCVLQSLHGICYALGFIACVTYVGKNTPAENAAESQSLFTVMQLITSIATVSLFGNLYGTEGAQAFWWLASIAAVGSLLSLAGMFVKLSAHTHTAGTH
jgi:MFS transporter, PPP family, 3-phenylpropionic acid transporter